MQSPALIVWERNGEWAPRLRRALGSTGPSIREVRSAAECLSTLSAAPRSVVVIEFEPPQADRVWATLWRIECSYPAARSLVLSGRECAEYAPQAFEAGARGFIMSSRELHRVARFVRRHFEVAPAVEPAGEGENVPELKQVVNELFAELSRTSDDRARRQCLEWLARRLPRSDWKMRKN